ncbi:MAG: hypothetical protein M1834_001253 [Cirrosporium novae-zelandiae]|nr:MAG: hypothetical protein M1834_001253 [Cirrosporium novae-zelandiae]
MSSTSPSTQTPPPPQTYVTVSFPKPHILLATLNRPSSFNCINIQGHYELDALWTWMDAEPSLRVGIVTGAGRAFCAGADLKEWDAQNRSSNTRPMPASGFGGLSRRGGKKPVIAAVNGIAYGGGCEIVVNSDMVIASSTATFAFSEVKIGVVAIAGALPRLVRTVGKQRAMEMALTGRSVKAQEAMEWGFVNRIVGEGEDVVKAAVDMADLVAANSPDAVIVSREGVKLGWEGVGADEGTQLLQNDWYVRLQAGENMKEGIRAFVEKRKPKWVDSKL